jgi:glycosyltransferase involved in cell wall biosynthesis
MTVPNKTNIALIIPGGIGTGRNNMGIPVLEQIVKLLAKDFNLTVFQLHQVNENYKVEGFELIDIHSANPILKSLTFFFHFWKIQHQRKFQVVHGFWALPCGYLAVVVGKIFRIKSVVSLQGGDAISLPEINYGQLQKWQPRKLALWSLRKCTVLISPSRYLTDNLAKFGFKRTNIEFIPLGIDTSLFAYQEKEIGPTIHFLHIGNFNHVKDQATVLRAFKMISDKIEATLVLVGEGYLEAKLKQLVSELGLDKKVRFQEPVPYVALPEIYHQADVLLHSSLSEGHPIVFEEAMSCGVLVCGTKVGLLYDLPGCCVAVPVQEHETLATKVLALLKDQRRIGEIRSCARAWSESHSILWTVEKLKEIYWSKGHL